MPATKTDLTIEQGATYAHGWAVTYNGAPIDGTWTVKSQARATKDSPSVLHEFAGSVDAGGHVVIGVPAATSSAWSWLKAVYDVEATKNGVTLRVAEGKIKVIPEVTR